jgi:Pilin accessory protein (PilO)
MKSIRIGSNMVVVGLEWMASQAVTSKEAIDEVLSQDSTKQYGYVVEGVDTIAVGLATKPEKGNVGAAWLADCQKDAGDCVLIESIGPDEYWLCAIKNGAPFYGSDLIGGQDHIEQEARGIMQTGGFRLITSEESFLTALEDVSVSQTHEGFDTAVKGSGSYKIKSLKMQKKTVLFAFGGVVVFVVLLMAGFYIYDSIQESAAADEMRSKQQQQAAKAAAAAEKAKVDFETAKKTAVENKAKEVLANLSDSSGSEMTQEWISTLGAIRLDTSGWSYSQAICTPKICTVRLKPTEGATNKELFTIFPEASLIDSGNAEIKIPVKRSAIEASLSNLKTQSEFTVDGITDFQKLLGIGLKAEWKDSKEMTAEINIPQEMLSKEVVSGVASKPASVPASEFKKTEIIGLGLAKGSFSIGGTQLWAVGGVGKGLTDRGVVYDNLTVLFDANQNTNGNVKSWIIEGYFYAKTK